MLPYSHLRFKIRQHIMHRKQHNLPMQHSLKLIMIVFHQERYQVHLHRIHLKLKITWLVGRMWFTGRQNLMMRKESMLTKDLESYSRQTVVHLMLLKQMHSCNSRCTMTIRTFRDLQVPIWNWKMLLEIK